MFIITDCNPAGPFVDMRWMFEQNTYHVGDIINPWYLYALIWWHSQDLNPYYPGLKAFPDLFKFKLLEWPQNLTLIKTLIKKETKRGTGVEAEEAGREGRLKKAIRWCVCFKYSSATVAEVVRWAWLPWPARMNEFEWTTAALTYCFEMWLDKSKSKRIMKKINVLYGIMTQVMFFTWLIGGLFWISETKNLSHSFSWTNSITAEG